MRLTFVVLGVAASCAFSGNVIAQASHETALATLGAAADAGSVDAEVSLAA